MRRSQLSARQPNVSNAIGAKIDESRRQYGDSLRGSESFAHGLLGANQMRGDGNFNLFQALGVFVKKVFLRRET